MHWPGGDSSSQLLEAHSSLKTRQPEEISNSTLKAAEETSPEAVPGPDGMGGGA